MNVYQFNPSRRVSLHGEADRRSSQADQQESARVVQGGGNVLRVDFRAGAAVRQPGSQPGNTPASKPCSCTRLEYSAADDCGYENLERVLEEGVQRLIAFKQSSGWSLGSRRAPSDSRSPTASVAAPITAINMVLERRPGLRRLLDHGGFRLFALYDDDSVALRYAGGLHWEPARVQDAACA